MDNWCNILDEGILKYNVSFAAMFVLNYECLKEYVIGQIREFYSENIHFEDDKMVCEESLSYKREVRTLDKNIENASLKWFIKENVITHEEYEIYQKIRQRRNDITHELLKNLNKGFNEQDVKLFSALLDMYRKIDKWWINEIEIPISGNEIPDDYDMENVCGGQAIVLSIINNIVLGNEGAKYKEVLESLLKV